MALHIFALTVAASLMAALLVHELGHVLAAGALGGHGFRLTRVWPALRVEATLPAGPGHEFTFFIAGAVANLGAAAALWGLRGADAAMGPVFMIAAALQLLVGGVALLPVGQSDGARLLALRHRP